MPLQKGDQAPEVCLPDASGQDLCLRTLRGRKVLLYFYPKAGTPGCTRQACAVRDARADLDRAGVVAVGISPDSPRALASFQAKHNLGFQLLSDPQREVAKAYGAYGEKKMYGKTTEGILRSAFLLDEQGRVLGAWYGIKPEATPSVALEILKKQSEESR
jgi:peroxiredoxin Q/BCP